MEIERAGALRPPRFWIRGLLQTSSLQSVTILNLRYYRQTYRLTEGCILQPKRYRTEFGKLENDLFLRRFVDFKNILVNFNANQETEEEWKKWFTYLLPIGPDRQKWKNLFVLDSFYFTQKPEAEKKSKRN